MSLCNNCLDKNRAYDRGIVACTVNEREKHHSYNDLPAMEYNWGAKVWLFNEQFHRLDAPAIVYQNGNKEWYRYDQKAYSIYDQEISVGKPVGINDDTATVMRYVEGCFYEALLGCKKVLIAKV